ncbi:uncharacterized protein [Triticum aestivum]|nr:uncharacterized protein LOC123140102 isoform X4 [Triticum aestivum]
MADAFRCLGKAARAALCAIARHLRLRTDVFNQLLDDTPLPVNEVSSSELLVAYSHEQPQSGHSLMGCPSRSSMPQVDRGFVTLVASDCPGIEVCDPNGHWYLADGVSGPNNLLLLTGRALSHVTAGLCPISHYRVTNENRASLTFRLVPHANAILDCSPILAAGHCIRQVYQPIPASQFMDDSYAEEHAVSSHLEEPFESQGNFVSDPSLRSVLSDPLSGAFLEDAMVLQCGHSFGGVMLKKVIEMARCTICNGEVDTSSLFPNLALRAVATVVKMEDDRRLFHNAALRKRRKDVTEHTNVLKRSGSSKVYAAAVPITEESAGAATADASEAAAAPGISRRQTIRDRDDGSCVNHNHCPRYRSGFAKENRMNCETERKLERVFVTEEVPIHILSNTVV